jgi:hypothetical protein
VTLPVNTLIKERATGTIWRVLDEVASRETKDAATTHYVLIDVHKSDAIPFFQGLARAPLAPRTIHTPLWAANLGPRVSWSSDEATRSLQDFLQAVRLHDAAPLLATRSDQGGGCQQYVALRSARCPACCRGGGAEARSSTHDSTGARRCVDRAASSKDAPSVDIFARRPGRPRT